MTDVYITPLRIALGVGTCLVYVGVCLFFIWYALKNKK